MGVAARRVARNGVRRCNSTETVDGIPCRHRLAVGSKTCKAGHTPNSRGQRDPFEGLGLELAEVLGTGSKPDQTTLSTSTVDLDEIESLLVAASTAPIAPAQPKPRPVMTTVPKKTPNDEFQITLSSHAVAQMEIAGKGGQAALDRIVGMSYAEITRAGKRLPDRNGRQFWRVRTGVVTVLFDIEDSHILVHGFAPRDR